jgi:WD40 repeat protein
MFATGVEGSVRVWTLPDDASAARLGDRPGRVELVRAGNDLVVQRPLECASWDPRARRIHSLARLPAASAREGDDELRRWPRAVSGDGKTCLFDGRDATTIVVGAGEHVIRQPVEQCVLSTDGSVATCVWKDSMFALELAGARVLASRSVPVIASLDTFRGTPVVLTAACTVEDLGGRVIAKLSAGPACELMRVDGDHIVIARGNRTAVWSAGVELELTAQLVDVYPVGEWVAVVHANDVDIVDARTEQPVAKPPRHELAIRRAAWSSTQLLATSDDETIQLWDPATRRARVIVAGQLASIAWSRDGKTLYATDGQVMYAWPIDMAAPTPNLDALTTARIVDGRAETP